VLKDGCDVKVLEIQMVQLVNELLQAELLLGTMIFLMIRQLNR
jgi:hypothetical protein